MEQGQRHRNNRILVIDDEPQIRASLRDYLEDSGYEVDTAEGGEAGLALFEQHTPDAVLCDLRMPDMSGQEVIERIAAHSPETPIIVVSGTGVLTDALDAVKRGAWDFISKPIADLSVLEHTLTTVMERAALKRKERTYQERLEAEVARNTEELRAEIEERVRVEARLRNELRFTAAVAGAGKKLLEKQDPVHFTTFLLKSGMAMTSSQSGAALYIDPTTDECEWVLAPGLSLDELPIPLEGCAESLLEAIKAHSHPEAYEADAAARLLPQDLLTETQGRPELARMCIAPSLMEGEFLGVLIVFNASGPYSREDIFLMKRLATFYALGLERRRAHEQLLRAAKAAQAADQAKTQFLANMSHELRTPLNAIMGANLLLEDTELTDEQREYLSMGQTSSRKLLGIVNNLLDLASLESFAVRLASRPFDVREMIEAVAGAVRVRAGMKRLDFRTHVEESARGVYLGDDFRLRQVLLSLLENAVAYTEEGSVRLLVHRQDEAEDAEAGNARLHFTVRDTGSGISEEVQKRIFDSFVLGEEYLTKRKAGAGLGLSIARQLVRLMGGDIWVRSREGQGSTFGFSIVLRDQDRSFCSVDIKADSAIEPTEEARVPNKTILLVEDDPENRFLGLQMLKKLGHTVLTAENGEEALHVLAREAAGASPVELIFMDVQMPVMDGLTATRHIRLGEIPSVSKSIPIIALTAYALKSDRDRILAGGMDEFISKPFDENVLRGAINHVFSTA